MIELETDIEKYLKKQCKRINKPDKKVLCLKCDITGYTGMPDRMILLPTGTVVFVELKKRGKKERARQRYVQQLLTDMGFMVFASVSTKEQVNIIIDYCQKELHKNGRDF